MTESTKTFRSFEDQDDRGVWFGLERWSGKGWVSINPEHPTFWSRDAADAYISLKLEKRA